MNVTRRAVRLISHRGRICNEEDGIPGNTLEAFRRVLAWRPDIEVETDVRYTHGGLLLVAHDTLLSDFTDGIGFVNNLQTREQKDLHKIKWRAGVTDHSIPELEEVLALFAGRGTIHLELKRGPGDPEGLLPAVLKVLDKFPEQEVVFSSFHHRTLLDVPADRKIGVLSNVMPIDLVADLDRFTKGGRALKHIAFHPDINNLGDDTLEEAHAVLVEAQRAGVEINAYTVKPEMFEWAADNGVNMITDYPMACAEFLARR